MAGVRPENGLDRSAGQTVNRAAWGEFERRIRERRAERLVATAREALACGDVLALDEALQELQHLMPHHPELAMLRSACAAAVPPEASTEVRPAPVTPDTVATLPLRPEAFAAGTGRDVSVGATRAAGVRARRSIVAAPLVVTLAALLATIGGWLLLKPRIVPAPTFVTADAGARPQAPSIPHEDSAASSSGGAAPQPGPTEQTSLIGEDTAVTGGFGETATAAPEASTGLPEMTAAIVESTQPVDMAPASQPSPPSPTSDNALVAPPPIGLPDAGEPTAPPAPAVANTGPSNASTGAPPPADLPSPTEPGFPGVSRAGVSMPPTGGATAAVPPLAEPTAAPPRRDPSLDVIETLRQYAAAYSRRDAGAIQRLWPTANAASLARAFDALEEQRLELDDCRVSVRDTAARASAVCRGSGTWVPRVGDRTPRVESRVWLFTLAPAADGWRIESARAGERVDGR